MEGGRLPAPLQGQEIQVLQYTDVLWPNVEFIKYSLSAFFITWPPQSSVNAVDVDYSPGLPASHNHYIPAAKWWFHHSTWVLEGKSSLGLQNKL